MEPLNIDSQTFLNTLDYIVIGVTLLSGFLALMRGFVRELFSLVAWVGAYFIAQKFYAPAIPWAHRYVKSDNVAEWVAMAGVFFVALIVLMILGHLICGLVKGKALTWIDRSLGFLYGLARGALVVCLIYLGAVLILWPTVDPEIVEPKKDAHPNEPPKLLLEARTLPLMSYGARTLKTFIPKEMIERELKDIEKQKDEAIETLHQKPSSSDGESRGPVDINKLFQKDNNQ